MQPLKNLQDMLRKLDARNQDSSVSNRETQVSKTDTQTLRQDRLPETLAASKPVYQIPQATKLKIQQAIPKLTFAQQQTVLQVVKYDTQRDVENAKFFEFTLEELSMISIVKIERLCDKFGQENLKTRKLEEFKQAKREQSRIEKEKEIERIT